MSLPADPRAAAAMAGQKEAEPRDVSPAAASDEVILATAGYDHSIKFWQAHTGQCVLTLQHPDSQVNAMDISPDGQLLAACGYQHIRMFDVNNGKPNPVVNYEGVSKNVMAVGFQEDGRWMYTGGEDATVKVWDLRMRNLQCSRSYQAHAPVNSVKLHPNQQELLIGDQSGRVHVWNLGTDASESCLPEPGASVQHVDIDPKGQMISAITNLGTCFVAKSGGEDWSLFKAAQTLDTDKIHAHKLYGLKCKFSPDSKVIVTTSADQTAKMWSTHDLKQLSELTVENQRWVWDVAFSADSRYLFTASSDNVARLWSIPTREVKRVYKENGHTKAVTCLAFRDGQVG